MQPFHRGERLAHVQRLKQNRKHYVNVPDSTNRAHLGKIVQYPAMCSCAACSPSKYRRLVGNSVTGLKITEQSAIQLLRKEY